MTKFSIFCLSILLSLFISHEIGTCQSSNKCLGCEYFEHAEKLRKVDKNYPEAINYYLKAIEYHGEADPKLPMFYHRLGHAYEGARRWDKAEAAFREAIKRESYKGSHYLCRGRMYFAIAKYDLALNDINEAIKKTTDGDDHEAFFIKGNILVKKSQITDAMPFYKKALSLCPDSDTCKRYKEEYDKLKILIERQEKSTETERQIQFSAKLNYLWNYVYYLLAIFIGIILIIIIRRQLSDYLIRRKIINDAYKILSDEIKYHRLHIHTEEVRIIKAKLRKVIEEHIKIYKYHTILERQKEFQELIGSMIKGLKV